MNSKSRWRVWIGVLAVVLLAAACSDSEGEATTTAAAPATETTATSTGGDATASGDWGSIDWRQFEGSEITVLSTAMPVTEIYASRIADFEALTGIKVDHVILNDTDRKNAQLVDFSGGTAEYDVGNVGISNREEFSQPGWLEPLQPYLDNPALTDLDWYNMADYPSDIISGGYTGADSANGTLVYLPFTAEYFLLWYRADIFDELGLEAPTTIEELETTAAALDQARQDGKIDQYAFMERAQAGAGEAGWNIFSTANRFDHQWVDFDAKTVNVDSPRGIEVLTYYTDLIINYGPPGSGNWTWTDISKAFSQGQIAMTIAGNASYTTLEDPSSSKVAGLVGYAPPPLAGGKDPLWEWGWSVNANSDKKEAAWLFVQWATSPTLMREISPEFGVPARESIYSDPAYLNAMPKGGFVAAQSWMLQNGVDPTAPFILSSDYGKVADLISRELNAVVAGVKDVEQAVKDAEAALADIGYGS